MDSLSSPVPGTSAQPLAQKAGSTGHCHFASAAAQWFGEQGLIEEGLKHALGRGDFELAADIIEDARLETMKMDKWPRLGKWLDSLPSAVENSRPHLLMSRAYVLMHSCGFAEIPANMDKMVVLEGESPSDPMLAGELNFFRGILAFFMGEVESCKRHFELALRMVPGHQPGVPMRE